MDSHLLWIWLRLAVSSNAKMMYALYQTAGSIETLFRAEKQQLTDWGVPHQYLSALTDKELTPAYNILGLCQEFDFQMVCIDDDEYPDALRQIALPPCILFYEGSFLECVNNAPTITVVGTRYSTAAGEAVAGEFAGHIALAGITVICGVANGIDTAVRRAVVQSDGKCVLLLPCGLLQVRKNLHAIYRDVLPHGAIVTELLPNETAPRDAYQLRNRIMSGLSEATLVCQAPAKSGSLITANYALEQGKEVFVLPGGIKDPSYTGGNSLLRDGATPIIDPSDIVSLYRTRWNEKVQDVVIEDKEFETYACQITEHHTADFQNELQKKIYSVMSYEPMLGEEIAYKSETNISQVLAQLTLMQLNGWVTAVPGGKYKLERL